MTEEVKEELDIEVEKEVDDKDFMTEVEIEGLDTSEETDEEKEEKEKKEKEASASEKDEDAEVLKNLRTQLERLQTDKTNLNKALHQERQKLKTVKKESEETEPLDEKQLLKILEENEGDSQTILNIVKYQAEQAARKITGEVVTTADLKNKQKEMNTTLYSMYPSLSDESSDMRKAVDETMDYYNLKTHPLGEAAAVGIQVLSSLPNMLAAAEKRGKEGALKEKADSSRKTSIKDNVSLSSKKSLKDTDELTGSRQEAAKQLNLTPSQMKTYKKLVAKGAPSTVLVKE